MPIVSVGAYGTRNGPITATSTKIARMTAPTTAAGLPRSRRKRLLPEAHPPLVVAGRQLGEPVDLFALLARAEGHRTLTLGSMKL